MSIAEAIAFINRFKDILGLRQRGEIEYPLDDVIRAGFVAVLAGAETFVDITRFGWDARIRQNVGDWDAAQPRMNAGMPRRRP